ncbi:protein ripply1 isoform X1 [Ovis aries]|nr:protein ripply1 isoform X1 [Ovis aries]XP_042097793.1 protein ripply1 isoform X1 [Ovis aries]XP_060264090.1 protein ripply1 isoform X1 [Ovis aries]
MSPGRPYKKVSEEKPEKCGTLKNRSPHSLPGLYTLRMDPPAPAAATPALALASAPALAQGSLALPYLGNPSPLLSSGQEVNKYERGASLWRPWLTSTNDLPRQVRKRVDLAPSGTTGAKVTKVDFEFHHPVRLFWPKSCSFDYLYSDGEMLLQNFPVQATINVYEDSTSEDEEEVEEREEEEKEEADGKGPEGCVKVPGSAPHRATAHSPSLPLTCPN